MDVQPTRMELIKLRRRIAMAKKGHALLKMKRDGLIMEFRTILEDAKKVIDEMVQRYKEAQEKLALAMAADGVIAVKSIALSVEKSPTFTLKRKNIMGVVVPVIKREVVRKSLAERNYGIIGTSARVDEAVEAYEALIDAILEVAEIETTLKKLIDEIERTKRRVNALEFKVIPEMEEAARYITFKLEEMDRENIIRLKKIKSKKEQAEA
ncbi:H{+}-transporting ATP synthase, vacuolar type, subunit D [Geoglobus ahangari]|uniref:A-type ATP synthase subunit D n=1 Tax=Geoglobus ahangari TaxID=113653 RepID=A0A0F7DBV8_9EURY|nr:V-type ATP synthase subunit D [Geoglobus ahangari]AKG91766.1 H{+}-transporting ATP synthase, vacuolar type, subunit D [Geoglobus ahangari]NOY10664.1 V-type ATP synthase subunit D [Archaeoglobi archaeon]